MASVDPFRRIDTAIQRVNDRHRIVLGSEHAISGGSATKAAGAAGIGLQTDRMETNRVLLLINLDAISIADSAGYRQQIRDPSVAMCGGGSSVVADEKLIHVRISVTTPIVARDYCITGSHPQSAFGHAEPITDFRKSCLSGVDQPVADVGRSNRT